MAACCEYTVFWCVYREAVAASYTRGVLWPRASKAEREGSGKKKTKPGRLQFDSAQTKKATGELEIYEEKQVTAFFC